MPDTPKTPRPAYSRSAENHPPAFRRLVEYKQRLEAENRGLRAINRGRNHEQRPRPQQAGTPGYYEALGVDVDTPNPDMVAWLLRGNDPKTIAALAKLGYCAKGCEGLEGARKP
jgi:hypothetical protein